MAAPWLRSIQAVCIDLSGTVHVGPRAVPGAIEALARLRGAKIPFLFVSNTTKNTRAQLGAQLRAMGFDLVDEEIFTSLTATKALVVELGLRPMLFLAEDAMEEFRDVETSDPDAVVVGLAPDKFDYASLNRAFRVLLAHRPTADTSSASSSASSSSSSSSSSPSPPPSSPSAPVPRLIAAHRGRFQANAGGDLDLGPGPFVAALEYATDVRSHVVGKPSPAFFEAARRLLERVRRRRVATETETETETERVEEGGGVRLSPSSILMIGDDARDDVLGAMACGWRGALVRTGKFRPGDEREGGGGGTIEWVADSFPAVIDALLEARSTER